MLNKKEFAKWFKTSELSKIMSQTEARRNYMNYMRSEGWYEKHFIPVPGSNQTHTEWVKDDMNCHGDVRMTAGGSQVFYSTGNGSGCWEDFNTICGIPSISLAPLATPAWETTACKPQPKQEKSMAYGDKNVNIQLDINQQATPKSTEADAARHLLGRLDSIRYAKRAEFEQKFNIYNSDTPKTYQELIAAIKAGDYTIDSKVEKRLELAKETGSSDDFDIDDDEDQSGSFYWGYGPMYGIKFTKLPNAPDHKGYKAAIEALNKEFTKTQDIIKVMPAVDGLSALQAFEAWTPTTETVH